MSSEANSSAAANPGGLSPVPRTKRQQFLRRYRMMGGPVPPSILDHQGIDDGFAEKASVRWYFHDGKWTQYPGAD
jgi:hypothetical protein